MGEVRRIDIGAFVKVLDEPHRGKGIGKVVRVDGRLAVVRFFDVPDDPDPPEITVPLSALKTVELPPQTRIFHFDPQNHRWRVGRVLNDDGASILIQFPNRNVQTIAREELETRWRCPIKDPTLFLARGVTETPRFAYARSGFMRAVTDQRAASLGMSALLSSRIELAPYQFGVIRRVLQDPVQRYLLADEVGLGKTIEAGVLIRQYLLDGGSNAQALVIAPAPLVAQWRHELRERFMLADWLDDYLWVVSSDDLVSIDAHLQTARMLVVDEAHHLSRQGVEGVNPLYERLRARVSAIPNLLLLSATPVLADTAGFLRILHLLDPVVFPLDDLQGFQRRLDSRQLVAETVAGLVPEHVLSMEDELDRLAAAFGDDPILQELLDRLRPIVQRLPEEDDPEFIRALSALTSHLSETYRLHRRVLRNRRRSVPWATPGRAGIQTQTYPCTFFAQRAQALDELRVHLCSLEHSEAALDSLFVAAVHPSESFSVFALLEERRIQDTHALELAAQIDGLAENKEARDARLAATVGAVRRLLSIDGQQVVVFCDSAEQADAVTDALRQALPGERVHRHEPPQQNHSIQGDGADELDDEEIYDVAQPWHEFLRDPSRCRILVCDSRAEEGLNLHGGRKVVVHYDLPANPNRLEQRLGRLDRFGAGQPVRSVAVVCEDDPAEVAWLACLDQGFDVFRQSIASLQYLIESSLRQVTSQWGGIGVAALADWCAQLSGPTGWVSRERLRIDQQDALDSLTDSSSELEAFERFEEVDDQWEGWRAAFESFVVENLQFRVEREPWSGISSEKPFRLAYDRDGQRATLLSLPAFAQTFLGTIDVENRNSRASNPLTYPYAFRRSTAISREGMTRGVRPLRCGDPLVESLSDFCKVDDRGRSFAMWRHLSGYEAQDASGVDLYFRFDVHVEPNATNLFSDSICGERAVHRRASGLLPPQFYTVWVGIDGFVSDTPPFELREPYSPQKGSDYNLNSQRWGAVERANVLPWLTEWKQQCFQAKSASFEFLRTSPRMQSEIEGALLRLERHRAERLAQLRARSMRLVGEARAAELAQLEIETDLFEKLAIAIGSPCYRVDVAGAIFLSSVNPFQQ